MNPRGKIDRHLFEICSHIRSRKVRRQVYRELLAHIEEAVELKLKRGVSEDEAIDQALLEFGPSFEIGRELGLTHRPLYTQSWAIAVFMAFLLTIGSTVLIDLTEKNISKAMAWQREIMEKHRRRFLADEEALSKISFFDFPGKERDAGALLNDRVDWEGAETFFGPGIIGKGSRDITMDSTLSNKVPRVSGWIEKSIQMEFGGVDLGWMRHLSEFDHWDLFAQGPLHRYLPRHSNQNFWSLPLPDFLILESMARIRLLRGISQGQLMPALRETRQLARLMYSTEMLIGEIVALNLLTAERDAFEYGREHGLISGADWEPIPGESVNRAKRALYAFPQVFSVWTDPSFIRLVFDGHTAKAGYCGALMERLPGGAIERSWLGGHWPLETDLRGRFELMNQVAKEASSRCRISFALYLWNNPELSDSWFESSSWRYNFEFNVLGKFPILRKYVLMGSPFSSPINYMARYENEFYNK